MSKSYSLESLNELAGGDQEFMGILARTFLNEIPPDLAALEEAVENDNKELAYQFAHKMKPNLEMFGVPVVKEITGIEAWTRTSKNKSVVESLVEEVVRTVNQVFDELRADFQL